MGKGAYRKSSEDGSRAFCLLFKADKYGVCYKIPSNLRGNTLVSFGWVV